MRLGWAFVLRWTLATAAALVLAQLALDVLWYVVLGWFLVPLFPLLGGVFGVAVGTLQWLVLRRHLPGSGAWVLATTAGFIVGGVLALVAMYAGADPRRPAGFAIFASVTPIIGLTQWAVVRRWTPRGVVWVLASAVGWTAFLAVGAFGPDALGVVGEFTRPMLDRIAGYATSGSAIGPTLVGGIAAGAITGGSLVWLLRAAR